MAIARVDEFLAKLTPLTTLKDIKILCNQELDYLRKELSIEIKFSQLGYPVGVIGDARRLKQQVSIYRKAIRTLETNSKNSVGKIIDGARVRQHKALRYFNLAEYEKRDVSIRDQLRWHCVIALE